MPSQVLFFIVSIMACAESKRLLASIGQNAEYQHLEKILMDAITTEPPLAQEESGETDITHERYVKYKTDYRPEKHEYYQEYSKCP